MRMRHRKKMIDRQSLSNINFARFIAALNQTVEEAYRSLDDVIDLVESRAADQDLRHATVKESTDHPPHDSL